VRSLAITIAIIGLVAPEATLADAPRLDSREYKLMLEPEHFIGDDPQDAIKQMADMIQTLIADHVSRKAAVDFSSNDFDLDDRRAVRFWDTAACDFDKNGFALRERSNLDDQGNTSGDRELTLKFRSADLFLVTQTPLPAMQGAKKPESKFEEDVAPLAVRTDTGMAVVADPPSIRSLYSRSTKQQVKGTNLPDTLEDAAELYPTLADTLVAGGAHEDMSGELTASEKFTEAYRLVTKEPLVAVLGSDHRLAARDAIDPHDIVGETFVSVSNTAPALRVVIDEYLRRSKLDIRPDHEVDNLAMAMSLIASRLGVALLPAYAQNFMPSSVTSRPIKGDVPTIDLVIGYNKANASPTLKLFLSRADDLIARVAKKFGGTVGGAEGSAHSRTQ
jgi:LysR substrate binding domain